jgi:phenolic acid decarboxylase
MLKALIAPRSIQVGSAQEDRWADPVGSFLSLKYAEPVYELYGIVPMPVKEHPEPEVLVKNTHMSYYMRKGNHNMTLYDWEQYINYADHYFGK